MYSQDRKDRLLKKVTELAGFYMEVTAVVGADAQQMNGDVFHHVLLLVVPVQVRGGDPADQQDDQQSHHDGRIDDRPTSRPLQRDHDSLFGQGRPEPDRHDDQSPAHLLHVLQLLPSQQAKRRVP